MDKKISIPVLLICLCSCSSNKDTVSCDKYKTGKFSVTMDTAPYSSWIINRNDSTQIEVNQATNDTIFNAIKWTDACEYELTFLKTNNQEVVRPYLKSKILKIKILESYKDYYIFKMAVDGVDLAPADTLRVLSN